MRDPLQSNRADASGSVYAPTVTVDAARPVRVQTRGAAYRYGCAVGAVLAATLLRLALNAVLGPTAVPYITYFPAVVAGAWIGGLLPGVLSVVLSATIAAFLFMSPAFSFHLNRPADIWSLCAFVLAGLSISGVGEAQRRGQLRAEQNAEEARKNQEIALSTMNSLRDAERQNRFLTDATEVLASSLDYEQTLQRVADLAVPHIADWCGVDMLEPNGAISQLAVAHVNPEKVKWGHELRKLYPPDPASPNGLPNVLRTGRSEIYTHLPDELLVAGARDARHLEMIRAIGLDSLMIVPIVARDRVLGAITFVATDESGHHYTEADLEHAESLAARAALAIDNARLYREAQQELAERRRVQGALRASEERFRFALANSDISFYITDRDLRYTWAYSGRRSAEITGIYGKTDAEFLIEDDALPLMEIKRRVLQTGVEERHVARATYQGEASGYYDTVFAPLRNEAGEVVGVTGTVTDVTERKAAQDVLARHQAEIEALNVRLLRSMRETHHRVKNNLQIVAALVNMQQMQYADQIPVSELNRLTQHIMALAAIHDLLTHQAETDTEVSQISVADVMDKLMPTVQGMVEGRTIVFEVDELRLPVRHSTTLAVLVNELVSNALKHGAGVISIGFHVTGEVATLEVRDQGKGFPCDFDPARAANTGLDLIESLARMDLHGEVCFENQTGGGARVVIRFPIPHLASTPGEQ
jgi:PAS domain S-box-containing protein